MTASDQPVWHTNIQTADSAETDPVVYPTRAYFTGTGNLDEIADLTEEQHIQAVAAHELGHFLVQWQQGAWMHSIAIRKGTGAQVIPAGVTAFAYPDGNHDRHIIIGGAAGERACDRWLHEENLWTTARAVYGEIQGLTDRQDACQIDPSITFDGGPNDYRHFQDEADRALGQVWPLLRSGLAHFTNYAEYTGDQMCQLLGISNNPKNGTR